MKPISNYSEIKASTGEFDRPAAGGYIVELLGAVDVPFDELKQKGAYLKIDYDIAVGEFKGYYTKQYERFSGEYKTNFIRSYKEKALGMFKHFTNCLEESNPGYKWDWDERKIAGKFIGVVLGEEEYEKKDGTIGTVLKVKEIKTVEQIANGDFKVPALKRLDNVAKVSDFVVVDDEESLPF